ncbi:MAG: chitobiase/beta-hexosaminidase C-terminal domain-containing protein, partial [Anaerohalosphaeraceae bacterium]
YTLDGSDPNNGMIYEAETTIPVEQSLTIRAVGLNAYMIPSEGASAAYRLVVATPTFTPDYGHYLTDQTVQIACATPGAVIYYTIDGSDPAQSGTVIENGGTVTVSVNPATTLKAIAFKGNMEPSAIKSAPYAQSHIIYVNTAATGANNGKTWANAFTRLQYALDVAMPWDEIWVVAGTYKPTKAVGGTELPFRTFQMKDGVDIYGGFNGTETSRDQRDWQANPTILSGDLYGDDVITPSGPFPWGNRGENCYHVVRGPGYYPGKGNTVLDGFTITGGNAVGRDDFNGGGMHNTSSYVTIRHCIFTANSTMSGMNGSGGGMYNTSSSPVIMDCVFVNNYSRRGAGMANVSGSNPTLIDCVFSDNIAAGGIEQDPSKGGAMYNWSSSSPIITNCIFNGNSSVLGGAVYNYSNSRPVFTNCTLRANSASTAGGALFNMSLSSPTMANCILWDNAAPMGPVMYSDSSDPIITYSNVEGGWTGEGNLDAAPLFVDAANGDLRLQAGSPCIDAGGNAAIPAGVASDLAGTPRIVDGNCDGNAVVDMGAYEYFLIGDMNFTCGVDMSDFDILAAHWLMDGCTSPDNCGQADIDRNGVVEMEDFIQFAEQWLQLTTK